MKTSHNSSVVNYHKNSTKTKPHIDKSSLETAEKEREILIQTILKISRKKSLTNFKTEAIKQNNC